MSSDKQRLRDIARARRDALSGSERQSASASAAEALIKHVAVSGRMVSLYYPIGSEIDARLLVAPIAAEGGRICLPVTHANAPLSFVEWDGSENRLIDSGFGTRVPGNGGVVQPDVMIMPLLGFDRAGNRLGWGKGHYDRTIHAARQRPLLVGLAFACQELEQVAAEDHDVPLDLIVTERGVIDPKAKD